MPYTQLRAALEAGPTEGVWNWHGDAVKGDPTGRVRFEVTTVGKTIARIYYSSYEGGPTNAQQDAAYIAAANPTVIRSLLDEVEALRAVFSELDRLMLVIESAVRWQDSPHHKAVVALVKANRTARALKEKA